MSGKNDGGAAFPGTRTEYPQSPDLPIRQVPYSGMTLRDWFAGQADIPWNAVAETLAIKGDVHPTVSGILEYRSQLKYIEADAMLKARDA